MNSSPSILTPDLGLLFWTLTAFLVVFGVLAYFVFPLIITLVDERKNYIDESLRKANEASERLENIKQEAEKIMQEAREKQSLLLKEAAETRDAIINKAREAAQEESGRLLSDAKKQIEQEKDKAIRDVRTQVAELSVQVAEKVLRTQLSSDEAQMRVINNLLDEVSAQYSKD